MSKLEFDPGFGPHVMAFQGTVEYLYTDINKFKNLSQRKVKFKQYYKKILSVFNNNLGFYIGCLMWAAYTKTQETQEYNNNYCLGQSFNEEENTGETDYMIKFAELFPKDMKYFLSENFEFEPFVLQILNTYKDFLTVNKGFVSTKTNDDIKLPENVKTKNAINFKQIIDKVIDSGDLSEFLQYKDLII